MPTDLPPVYGGEILHVHLDTGETTDGTAEIAERIYNLERLINVSRDVASRETDALSHRVHHEPILEGPAAGKFCPPEELDALLSEYYDVRGWNHDGFLSDSALDRLELSDVSTSLL